MKTYEQIRMSVEYKAECLRQIVSSTNNMHERKRAVSMYEGVKLALSMMPEPEVEKVVDGGEYSKVLHEFYEAMQSDRYTGVTTTYSAAQVYNVLLGLLACERIEEPYLSTEDATREVTRLSKYEDKYRDLVAQIRAKAFNLTQDQLMSGGLTSVSLDDFIGYLEFLVKEA